MPRILVIFGTKYGQTAKIAHALGDRLRLQGFEAELIDASHADPDPLDYDGIIVAAAVHGGGYPRAVTKWATAHAPELNRKVTAFVSVCLGVLQHEPHVQQDLKRILETFLEKTSWRPLDTLPVAGALVYTRYNFLVRWAMKRIARKAGGDTDTSRDFEYTDWAQLERFADRFGARFKTTARLAG